MSIRVTDKRDSLESEMAREAPAKPPPMITALALGMSIIRYRGKSVEWVEWDRESESDERRSSCVEEEAREAEGRGGGGGRADSFTLSIWDVGQRWNHHSYTRSTILC